MESHKTRFVLCQHYFRVPLFPLGEKTTIWDENIGEKQLNMRIIEKLVEGSKTADEAYDRDNAADWTSVAAGSGGAIPGDDSDELLRLWFVSDPFEVVCIMDTEEDEDEEVEEGRSSSPEGAGAENHDEEQADSSGPVPANGNNVQDDDDDMRERPRPLVAVDFGHAVWIEFVPEEELPTESQGNGYNSQAHEDDSDADTVDDAWSILNTQPNGDIFRADYEDRRRIAPKRLRFVTFPPINTDPYAEQMPHSKNDRIGVVRTLEVPNELDLSTVETINIDQSQGAVILSVREGKIFILCYE
jgi:hypothetical protein